MLTRPAGKAAVAAQRTERLARQNPGRLEQKIGDLKALEASSGSLSARDRRTLEELERDIGRIRKAKDAAGVKQHAPRDGVQAGVKRRWDERGAEPRRRREDKSSGEETDESVRRIPMPKDTPPPMPRRDRRQGNGRQEEKKELPPVAEAKTVYEAKPVLKDFRKEAVGFVPSAVKRKIDASKGTGGKLLEAEEMDKLEALGYGGKGMENVAAGNTAEPQTRQAMVEDVPDEDL